MKSSEHFGHWRPVGEPRMSYCAETLDHVHTGVQRLQHLLILLSVHDERQSRLPPKGPLSVAGGRAALT
jgi:hypothetical protein